MSDWSAVEAQLKARRAELVGELNDIENTLDEAAPKDWEDRAAERQGDEVLESMGHLDLAELKRIDAALARLEDGSYGECVKCGNPISAERLHAVPDAPLCVNCAS